MGEVIRFAEIARARRVRTTRAVHAACRWIIDRSVHVARVELATAPPGEWPIRVARLRKLEELQAYVAAIG